jgi:hypothetical protein
MKQPQRHTPIRVRRCGKSQEQPRPVAYSGIAILRFPAREAAYADRMRKTCVLHGSVESLLRGLGTQVAWVLWPADAALDDESNSGGSRARATERRLASRSRASRAAPPNRACSRHPAARGGVG